MFLNYLGNPLCSMVESLTGFVLYFSVTPVLKKNL